MKQIVLIDGENFLHTLLNVLHLPDDLPGNRDILLKFEIRELLTLELGLGDTAEIVYFGTKLRLDTASSQLKDKVEQTRAFQAKWANILMKQKIQFIKAGYLRAREGTACVECGNVAPYLLEKGVDVALAVRIVQEASPKTEIIVISSDTDLLPAFKVAKNQSKLLVYVGLEDKIIYALANTAHETRVLSKKSILKFSGRVIQDAN